MDSSRSGSLLRNVSGDLVLPPDPYGGRLSRAWVQDEVVTADHLPASISLPRR